MPGHAGAAGIEVPGVDAGAAPVRAAVVALGVIDALAGVVVEAHLGVVGSSSSLLATIAVMVPARSAVTPSPTTTVRRCERFFRAAAAASSRSRSRSNGSKMAPGRRLRAAVPLKLAGAVPPGRAGRAGSAARAGVQAWAPAMAEAFGSPPLAGQVRRPRVLVRSMCSPLLPSPKACCAVRATRCLPAVLKS